MEFQVNYIFGCIKFFQIGRERFLLTFQLMFNSLSKLISFLFLT